MAQKPVSEQTLSRLAATAPEVVFVGQARVACDGGDAALGHPKVWYTIGDEGYAECSYCDRVFVLDPARAGQTLSPAEDA